MNAHLIAVPSLTTLTARSLASGNAKNLGGHASGTLYGDTLLAGLCDDVTASYNGLGIIRGI